MIYLLIVMLAFIEPQMSSKKASFDGKQCILEDDVVLDHPFGRLKTDKAVLEKGDSDKLSFEKAVLENHVEVFLNSGSTLKGRSAFADLTTKQLKFSGDVIFQEPDGLKIFAQNAESHFEEKDSKFIAHSVSALEKVRAEFPEGRVITCHEAFYKPGSVFELKGNETTPCHLVDLDLDLKTSEGRFDLKEEKGSLKNVEANLSMPIAGVKSALKLKANEIEYSEKTQIIESHKYTFVESQAYCLKSELDTFKVKLGANKQVEEAVLDGLIHITGPQGQTLECPGLLRLHEGKQLLVLKAHEGEFITCKTQDLLVKASRARLFYKQDGNKFIPMKLELEDKVQLFDLRTNRKIYGKAHKAHMFMHDDRLHLYGDGSNRVLYVDESLDLTLSAPEVLVQKNDEGKLSVQGVGAVRFSFNDEEQHIIQKIKKLAHE